MVYLLFFLSGAAGLIYEMAWSRQLGLLFGHTVNAAAVVLAAYFSGMALGYWLAARYSHRIEKPLAAYGWAELVVCAWAVITPFVLAAFSTPAIAALINHPDPALQTLIRAGATFLVLLPATAAMGATLPFIAKHLDLAGLGKSAIALAYSCNTGGAVTGVLLATFVLILFVGVRGSGYIAAGLSALCGICALVISRNSTLTSATKLTPESSSESAVKRVPIQPQLYWLAGLSGAGALGFQVLYTKMFALVFHNSTYTFGLVVAVFLLALALGSWFVARYSKRYPPQTGITKALLYSPAAAVVCLLAFQYITKLDYFTMGNGFLQYVLAAFGLVLITILPPVAIMGAILPYLWGAAKGHGAASTVGRLAAVNTIAAAFGALSTSFVLLPLFGLWKCFALFALVYFATGLWLAFKQADNKITSLSTIIAFPLITGLVMLQFMPGRTITGSEVLYKRDTAYGIISVVEKKDKGLWLQQNIHYTLGSNVGGDSELRQGHIPLLLHPEPRNVCFLGLATGITASSALMHPEVEHVTAVELIPEVVVGASYFAEHNGGILDDPHFTGVVNDARHYLYATEQSYDVIISDLFVPWHSQTGYLYTVEHYRAARNKLKDGGLFCQWLPLYQLGPNELDMIANTFAEVFPEVTLWRGEFAMNGPLLALVGSEKPVKLDGRDGQVRIANLPAPFTGTDPYLRGIMDLLDLYVGSWEAAPNTLLNTDEHPRLEFLAPIAHRDKVKLIGDQLKAYYVERLNSLPTGGIDYTPRQAEPMPTLGLGKLRQQELEPKGEFY